LCANHAAADDEKNVLANGNFANGKASWKGDIKDGTSSDMTDIASSMSDQGKVTGMMVALNGHWTKFSQVFSTRETALNFSMTYQTSADFAETPLKGGNMTSMPRTVEAFFLEYLPALRSIAKYRLLQMSLTHSLLRSSADHHDSFQQHGCA